MEEEIINSCRNNLMCRLCLKTINVQLLSNIIDTINIWPDKINKLTGIDVIHNLTFFLNFFFNFFLIFRFMKIFDILKKYVEFVAKT